MLAPLKFLLILPNRSSLIFGLSTAAPGIAIGPIYLLQHEEIEIEEAFQGATAEQERLQKAIERARGQLIALHKKMLKSTSASEAAIFEVHLKILDDPDLLDAVLARIDKQQSAAQAWRATIDARAQVMAELNDPLLARRAADIQDVGYRVLRRQLRAILRAAEYGPLRIMFLMVADLSEWRAARAMVAEVQAELGAPQVDLGIMIEVPSAALMADAFAQEVDFFSVGTNDLTQYTLAMDRMHPSLAGKSDGLHPAVLRLIERTVEAAHAAGKWVGVCGELGADPQAVPILIGLGVDELSVSVPAIASVKAQIRCQMLSYGPREH